MTTDGRTAGARAYAQLRREILDGQLSAKTVLFEVEQSTRLGVSRTPVREALRKLEADGLVAASGGRGLAVTEISTSDLKSIFELRACLEAEAARLAALRGDPTIFATYEDAIVQAHDALLASDLTDEEVSEYYALIRRFDAAVDDASENPFLVDALDNLRIHAARARRMASHSPTRLAASATEHALIARSIAAGNSTLAVHATHVHLNSSLEYFLHVLKPAPSH